MTWEKLYWKEEQVLSVIHIGPWATRDKEPRGRRESVLTKLISTHFLNFLAVVWKKAQFRTPHLNPFSSAAMATELPYAADAEVSLSYDELEVCILLCFPAAIHFVSRCLDASTRRNYLNRTSPSRPNSTMHGVLWKVQCATTKSKVFGCFKVIFSASLSLCKLTTHRLPQEIFRAEPSRRRECLFYLALGHYKMTNYEEAKRFNGWSNLLTFSCLLNYLSYCSPSARKGASQLTGAVFITIDWEGCDERCVCFAFVIAQALIISGRGLYWHGTHWWCSSGWWTYIGRSPTPSSSQVVWQFWSFFPVLCWPHSLAIGSNTGLASRDTMYPY